MKSFRIVAFGSSSTEGSGATTPACSYPAQLAGLFRAQRPTPPVEVLNKGVGGDDIDDMLARLDRDVSAASPDLVLWQVGSNDPLRGVNLTAFADGLADGVARLQAAGAEVMLMEPQWSPALDAVDPDHAFVEAVRTAGHRHGLHVIRRFDLMRGWFATGQVRPEDAIGPDGLHMTDLGYRLLAEAVFEAVVRHSARLAALDKSGRGR